MKYAAIRDLADTHPVTRLCRALEVSRSGYYAWIDRPESRRSIENQRLLARIRELHAATREAYGALKTWKVLAAHGVACSKHRVARLRRINGIEARRKRRFRVTTQHHNTAPPAPDRLRRCFTAARPDRVWVGDITYIPTRAGWLYLAVLLDLYSRRVVGWAMADRINQNLTLGALKMAILHRRPAAGLVHHTDQGRQYAAQLYQDLLHDRRMLASMSRKGEALDNAVAESFFSTLKNELVHHRDFKTRDQARTEIFDYIELFYNRQRAHATLRYRSPIDYENTTNVPN